VQKKPPSPTPANKPASDAQQRANTRHRFSDSETTIMPLAEILRSREASQDPEMASAERNDVTRVDLMFDGKTGLMDLPPSMMGATGGGPDRAKGGTAKGSLRANPSLNTETQALVLKTMTPMPPPSLEVSMPAEKKARSTGPGPAAPPTPPVARPEPTQMLPAKMAAQVQERPGRGAEPVTAARHQVLVFFSCKGGAGATALSLNVAHHFARDKHSTCIVDLDLQLGDALAALALQPRFTIAQATQSVQKGEDVLVTMLPSHASGVSVLSQVGSLDDLDQISSEGVAQLVEDLRDTFDAIVVDGVRDFGDNVLAVLDVADKIAIVTVQEVLAVRRARWSFNILRKIGFDPKDITIVINRFDPAAEISYATIKRIFEPCIVLTVPSDGPLVLQSLNRGVPLQELAPNHTVTRNIARLARNLVGDVVPEQNEITAVRKPSFWKRLFGRGA
jgi:Flp pilus assembly CpaE family ATPase